MLLFPPAVFSYSSYVGLVHDRERDTHNYTVDVSSDVSMKQGPGSGRDNKGAFQGLLGCRASNLGRNC